LARCVVTLMGDPIRVNLGALPHRPGEMWRMVGDNSRARQALEWQPTTPLDDGLRRTIAWCATHLSHDG